MAITVQIPTPLRDQTGQQAEVPVAGNTIAEALSDLVRNHPGLTTKLFDGVKLRPHVNVFLNDEDIRYLDEMDTPVNDGQVIALIPAVAGG